MAVDSILFIGVLFLIVAIECAIGFLYISKKKNKNMQDVDEESEGKRNFICRFVLDGAGKKIGESVAIDNDIVIIKSGAKYLGVPLKHIEEEEKTLLVKGLMDKDKAEEMGEKWRQESFREIEHTEGKKDGI